MHQYSRKLPHFILFLMGFSIILFVFPSLVKANFSSKATDLNFIPQQLLQSTPDPSKPFLPESELDRFIETAQIFNHPESRKKNIDQNLSVKTIFENSNDYDGIQYSLQGRVVTISQVQNLLPEDWSLAYVITINDKTDNLQILYRGDGKSLRVGDQVIASGVFVGTTKVLHADLLYKVYKPTNWFKEIPKNLGFTLMILLLVGLLPIFILIWGKKIKVVSLSILIVLFLSACELDIDNIVHSNGSVSTSIKISESTENMDFFRDVPGMNRYIAGWIANLRNSGSKIDNWVIGKQEYYHLQNKYPDLESFSKIDNMEPEEISSWVYSVSYEAENKKCYRYLASINPQTLYVSPPNTEPSVIREMNKEIDKIQFKYGVKLPGQIIYTNADTIQENHIEWQLRMKNENQIIAESCSFIPRQEPDWLWGWLGVLGFGLIDIGLWVIAIKSIIFRRRKMKALKE